MTISLGSDNETVSPSVQRHGLRTKKWIRLARMNIGIPNISYSDSSS